jgi:hypothetical protein
MTWNEIGYWGVIGVLAALQAYQAWRNRQATPPPTPAPAPPAPPPPAPPATTGHPVLDGVRAAVSGLLAAATPENVEAVLPVLLSVVRSFAGPPKTEPPKAA